MTDVRHRCSDCAECHEPFVFDTQGSQAVCLQPCPYGAAQAIAFTTLYRTSATKCTAAVRDDISLSETQHGIAINYLARHCLGAHAP